MMPSRLNHIDINGSFLLLWLNNTYGHNIFYSFILSYYDYYGNDDGNTDLSFKFWFHFILIHPLVAFLSYMRNLFWETSIAFSTMAVSILYEFHFFHIYAKCVNLCLFDNRHSNRYEMLASLLWFRFAWCWNSSICFHIYFNVLF